MKIINSLPLITSLKPSLMATAIIFSMLLLSACEGGSSSSSSNTSTLALEPEPEPEPEPDASGLLIPVDGDAELLSMLRVAWIKLLA